VALEFAHLLIETQGEVLLRLNLNRQRQDFVSDRNDFIDEVTAQLHAYQADPGFDFDINLAYPGTDFRLRVYQAMIQLKAGDAISYGELAQRLQTAPRAIGGACRANPYPIIVPCHRILAANGGLGGFACGLQVKRDLLEREGVRVSRRLPENASPHEGKPF